MTADERMGDLRHRLRRTVRHRRIAARLWLERTSNLIHLSVLVFVPLLIAVVTWLSNTAELVTFLLFPPLAAGTYALFSNPSDASPWQFVVGITAGAVCGSIAVAAVGTPTQADTAVGLTGSISPEGAALSGLLAAVVTWVVGVDEPSAFSTALLVLVTGGNQLVYVVGVAASSVLVATGFVLYRERIYERRGEYLYRTVRSDDAVLVPMWEASAESVAHFAARIAGAHDAGKVALVGSGGSPGAAATSAGEADTVATSGRPADEVPAGDDPAGGVSVDDHSAGGVSAGGDVTAETIDRLEALASTLRTRYDVDVEVAVVQPTDRVRDALAVAADTGCDLVAAPYDPADPAALEALFQGAIDVIGLRSRADRTAWDDALVGIRSQNALGRASIDFATRLASRVSLCHAVADAQDRRAAERMLDTMADAFGSSLETRVTTRPLVEFLNDATAEYDLLVVGASTDRSDVSRAVAPPTYRGIDPECDLAVVHLADPESTPEEGVSATAQNVMIS